MVLELAKTLASELHDKWEVLEGREQLNKVVALYRAGHRLRPVPFC